MKSEDGNEIKTRSAETKWDFCSQIPEAMKQRPLFRNSERDDCGGGFPYGLYAPHKRAAFKEAGSQAP